MRAPVKVRVLVWHVSHGAVVTRCEDDLPVAVRPLWHEAQLVTMPVWSMLAPVKVRVLVWQLSHGAVVAICEEDLPVAVWPLWQDAQAPVMPV